MAMERRQSMALAAQAAPQNPIAQVQARIRDLDSRFRSWLKRQPIPVETAVVTTTGAVQGAALGGLMGTFSSDISSAFPTPPPQAAGLHPDAMASFKRAQAMAGGPLVQARNFAVMTGVNAGISCAMKRIRGVDDVQNSMVAAFGSGALFSLVSGMGGTNPVAGAVSSGFFFALAQGGFFMLGQKFSQPPADNVLYSRTRSMLASLGLEKYEKNFKKGLLTDCTLPLLTDSALRDVRIPPGPRLLILNHIHSDSEPTGGRQ